LEKRVKTDQKVRFWGATPFFATANSFLAHFFNFA
jgi:hypothetical protein